MRGTFPFLVLATTCHAYWYPNSYTRNPSSDEDCYSQADDPYSITCHATNDFVYAPCSDLFIPSTPARPNNFTYFAICIFPDEHMYDKAEFWSEIITVDICENYWDACISDNSLAKYDDTINFGMGECRKVTDRACGKKRNDEFTVPESEAEDTTRGAFDLGPYSTVSQVTVPRISMTEAGSSGAASMSGALPGSATATNQQSASGASSAFPTLTPSRTSASSSTGIVQVTNSSKADRRIDIWNPTAAAGLVWLCLLLLLLI